MSMRWSMWLRWLMRMPPTVSPPNFPGEIKVSLNSTKGKKALHSIKVLRVDPPAPAVDHAAALESATNVDTLKDAFKAAYRSTKDEAQRAAFKATYDARLATLLDAAA
jgi:hypothetical protein